MKAVDMDSVCLVHSGEAWGYQQPPCSRQMIRHLERNEGVVTWVQVVARISPVQGGLPLRTNPSCPSPRQAQCLTSFQ